MKNNILRRSRLDLMSPEELIIFSLIRRIESMGAHPYLTDVIILLGEAKNKLADWLDFEDLKIKDE